MQHVLELVPIMSNSNSWIQLNFDGAAQCQAALDNVHAFLHGELTEEDADHIRQHLVACEDCMDNYEIEELITELIQRSHSPVSAPERLRIKISAMHVMLESQ